MKPSSRPPSRRPWIDKLSMGEELRPLRLYPLLYLLPLAPIFDLSGYLPPFARLGLVYVLLLIPIFLRMSRRGLAAGVGVAAVMVLEATVELPTVADLALLLLAHQWVWTLLNPPPARLTAGLLFYTLLHLFLFLSPLGFPILEHLARAGNRLSGWITGSGYHLGFSYQNIGGLLLLLSLSVFGWDGSLSAKLRTVGWVIAVILINGFLAALLIRRADFGAEFAWDLKYREVFGTADLLRHVRALGVLFFPALVFGVYLVAYLFLHYESWSLKKRPAGAEAPPAHTTERGGLWPLRPVETGLLVAAMAFLLLAIPPTTWRNPAPFRLVLVERGVVSFTRPDYQRFGRAAGGMYGMLPDYARLFGCTAEIVPDIPETLEANDVLVLTNWDEPLTPERHRRVWDFVASGGRLWVLGDHTFIKNGRNHINDLLAPCHLELRHDSAQFFPQGWFNSYRFRQGTAFAGLSDAAENRPAILVGASIDVRAPAQPLVIGRFGYSDWGVTTEDDRRGYIGDFEYQPEERLGDLVLVAGERFGEGRVLVFGDTTSFFNNNLSRSYEILRATLSWFGEDAHWTVFGSWGVRIACGLLLGGLLVGLMWRRSAGPVLAFGTLGAFACVSLLAYQSKGGLKFDTAYAQRHLAVLDFAHQPFASKHGSMNSGLHGVSINLMRHGQLPATINRWDRKLIDAAGLVVINAPRHPFSAAERRDLMRLMERGGTVLLTCGFPDYAACRSLLDPLQLEVRGLPLGRFFDRTAFNRPVSFMSAWPLIVHHPDASVLCVYDDWPLIAQVPVGGGRLVLVGDSEFLHNRNLEGFENYDPANIQFLRSLLDFVDGGPDA